MPNLTEKQLISQIKLWRRTNKSPVYGIRSREKYDGRATLEIGEETFQVSRCRSDLEAREILANRSNDNTNLVLLFSVGHEHLSEDVLVRLAKERLLNIDPHQSLREVFQVTSIDPRIGGNSKMVEALIEAGAGSVASMRNPLGLLDMNLAWSILLKRPEIAAEQPDLATVLRWSLDEDEWESLGKLDPGLQDAFFAWLKTRHGEAALGICAAIHSSSPELLVPIGLALRVLYGADGDRNAACISGRVLLAERYFSDVELNASSAMAWHQAAVIAARDSLSVRPRELGRRLDQLLSSIRAEELMVESDFSVAGYAARVERFAEALESFIRRKKRGSGEGLIEAFEMLKTHALAEESTERLNRAEMAIRLAHWLAAGKSESTRDHEPSTSLALLMKHYFKETSHADRARFALFGGDSSEALSKVYGVLLGKALKRRVIQQEAFARSVQSWSQAPGNESILGIESVIDRVVAPLAKQRPVLLLVFDGMSAAVFHELMEDLQRKEWFPISHAEAGVPGPVLATIPSVTNVSRAALFRGHLDASQTTTEQVAFREQRALSQVSPKAKPRLFLKADLTQDGGSSLNPEIRDAIASSTHRIVGVILNVVDEQLSGSDQLKLHWRSDTIEFLNPILEAAAQAARNIILISDHGHLPELNQTRKLSESGSDSNRYRERSDRPLEPGEIVVTGPRIQSATGKTEGLVVPATESLRYGKKAAGYHGGATDLELVVPLAILESTEQPPEGWDFQDSPKPSWWAWQGCLRGETKAAGTEKKRTRKMKKRMPAEATQELPLFGEDRGGEPAVRPAWIDRLAESELFRLQIERSGKGVSNAERVLELISALEQRNGSALMQTVSADLNQSAPRLRGLLAKCKRILNVDGYLVLSEDFESQTIQLDSALLKTQFGIA